MLLTKALLNGLDYPQAGYGREQRYRTYEDSEGYYLEVELAGTNESDIVVEVIEGLLHVKAERHANVVEQDDKGETKKVDKLIAKFDEKFRLPEDANIESINAEYKNGLLSITIGKQPKIEKRIEIKSV